MHKNFEIIFCLVNYKTPDRIIEYAKNVLKHSKLRLVIVENSGQVYEEIHNLSTLYENQLIYYINNENTGYLNGLNKCLQLGISHWGLPDWAVFSNSDISFSLESFLLELEKDSSNHRNIGLWGCSIISSKSNRNQNPFLAERPSKIRIMYYMTIYSSCLTFRIHNILSVFLKKIRKREKKIHNNFPYGLHGSFFCLSKDFIAHFESFSWPCFLYGEEIFLAERLKKTRMSSFLNEKLTVIHYENESTSLLPSCNRRAAHFNSMKFLYKEFWKDGFI